MSNSVNLFEFIEVAIIL